MTAASERARQERLARVRRMLAASEPGSRGVTGASSASGAGDSSSPAASGAAAAFVRAENEDDDGYDPYSDRREEPPLFEPDPWR